MARVFPAKSVPRGQASAIVFKDIVHQLPAMCCLDQSYGVRLAAEAVDVGSVGVVVVAREFEIGLGCASGDLHTTVNAGVDTPGKALASPSCQPVLQQPEFIVVEVGPGLGGPVNDEAEVQGLALDKASGFEIEVGLDGGLDLLLVAQVRIGLGGLVGGFKLRRRKTRMKGRGLGPGAGRYLGQVLEHGPGQRRESVPRGRAWDHSLS
jgi:hypothetical protein